jgi:hypothetical protein
MFIDSVRLRIPLALSLVLASASAVRADVAAPEPATKWARGQEPESNTIVAAGAAISAVLVAAGLILGRWPVRSGVGRIVVAAVTALLLLAVWGVAGGAILQAERDRGLWKQWEVNEANRRANWRPPPGSIPDLGPPPPELPAPESSASAPPTSPAESVQ